MYVYGTAHIQVYKNTHVIVHALRNLEDNLHVGFILHKEYTARKWLLMSCEYSRVRNSSHAILYSWVITDEY